MMKLAREGLALILSFTVLLVVGFAGMTTMTACGWLKSEGRVAGKALIDCAKADVTQVGLLSDVTLALKNGEDGLFTTLDALGLKYGSDALACGVKAVEAVFVAAAPSSGSGASHASLAPEAQLAERYLALRGISFK